MERTEYLARLINAIREVHHVEATHRETVPVVERFKGKVFFEGEVEVFGLTGHSTAEMAYAWGYPSDHDSEKLEVTTVLGLGPVNSPKKAVQAAIRQETKQSVAN